MGTREPPTGGKELSGAGLNFFMFQVTVLFSEETVR